MLSFAPDPDRRIVLFPWRCERSVAVHLRLFRVGKAKAPHYRLVAADSRAPRDGKFLEILGHYDPRAQDGLVVKAERARYWMSKGARPTDTVRDLLLKAGFTDEEVPAATRP